MSAATSFRSVFRPNLFAGQTALITGGGSGIGRCIAHELAALGATVVIAGRREAPLQAVVKEIEAQGGKAYAISLNIRDEDAVDAAINAFVAEFGPIHLLVNNAGGQFASPAAAIKPKGWKAVIDTNLNGTWFVSQAVFNHSMRIHGGAIVTIVADMWNGFPGMAHTGAARAGVVNLAQSLAIEWAPFGVRVNCVAPGYILTSGLHTYPEPVQAHARQVFASGPSGRAGTESEVSAATCFLLSPAAAYISGTTLRVDGASSLQKEAMLPVKTTKPMPAFQGFHLPADVPERFKDMLPPEAKRISDDT